MKHEYHYFFYGMASENELNTLIQEAEDAGCEFLQVLPMAVPAAKVGALSLPGQPQMLVLFRLFVRCPRHAVDEVDKKMKAKAAADAAKPKKSPIIS